MTRRSLVLALVVAPALVGTQAHAIPLGSLIAGGTIEVGDKTFTNFEVHDVSAQFSTPADPLDIDVEGFTNAFGEHGLRLSGIGATVSEGGSSGSLTFALEYDVSVSDPQLLLHDVRHAFTSLSNRGGAMSLITQAGFSPDLNAFLQSVVGSGGSGELIQEVVDEDEVFLNDVTLQHMLHVFELHAQVVNLTSQGGPIVMGEINTSPIDLTFSQIPEPSTVILLATGVASLVSVRRRRAPPARPARM
jgi:PEP-CTERM motif